MRYWHRGPETMHVTLGARALEIVSTHFRLLALEKGGPGYSGRCPNLKPGPDTGSLPLCVNPSFLANASSRVCLSDAASYGS
jgi:hypothetical protein